jgi:SAM-dependent methyltransferase
MSDPGLDYEFLRHIGYDAKRQKEHQRFYLQFFEECERVVDLGCGGGDFVELLIAGGVDAIGVDVDPLAAQAMRARETPVAEQDVFAYLEQADPASVDGIYAAHLVEHLPYDKVLELIRLAYRTLRPGGVIVLTTPDPRSLYAHLEMFYLHFGHVSFYDPRLLCFFLEHVGFAEPASGSNDSSLQHASPYFGLGEMHPIRAKLPVWRRSLFRRALRAVRMAVAYVLLNPYLDLINSNFERLFATLRRIDRPFECYATAVKPGGQRDV